MTLTLTFDPARPNDAHTDSYVSVRQNVLRCNQIWMDSVVGNNIAVIHFIIIEMLDTEYWGEIQLC